MIKIIDLQTALLDLLEKIQGSEIRLIIGGGFGIYLKTNYAKRQNKRTLFNQWPEPRSTNDLDLFLRPELLIESSKLKPMVSAITDLGYQVVPGAENYQYPYTFSMMKLFAFRDRLDDSDKEFGRYHALDLYTILATTTEEEWEYALQLRDQYKNDRFTIEAGHLVSDYFSGPERLGMIRLRESHYYRTELQIEKFMSVLQELFPVGADPFSRTS
jgi:hypothetical protein